MTVAVAPAAEGTHPLGDGLLYTAGAAAEPVLVDLMRRSPVFAVDIETYGIGALAHQIKCVTFAHQDHAVVLDPRVPRQAMVIRRAAQHATELIFHNSPFDVPAMFRAGLLTLDDVAKVVDTLIFARMAEPDERTTKDLLSCGNRYLDLGAKNHLPAAFRMLRLKQSDGYRVFDIDRPVYLQGAATDGIVTARLRPVVEQAAYDRTTKDHPFTVWGVTGDEARRLVWREQQINRMMLRRACRGLRVDYGFLDRYAEQTSREQQAAETELAELGIRPGVTADLARWMDDRGLIPPNHPKTPTGLIRMRSEDAKTLDHPVARLFVRHKQISKVSGDYLVKVRDLADDAGRIHPVLNMFGAATGRMSMGDPPLQQFPAEARGMILADPGDSLVSIDWSQIEPVVAANVAKERGVLEGYEAGTSDLYTDIAARAGIARKTAKVVLLAQLYGEGIRALAASLGISQDEAKGLRQHIFRTMPRVHQLIQRLRAISEDHQKVFTLSGRILTVPMGTYDGRTGVQTHKGVNYFVQGSAYDVLAEALVAIDQAGLGDAVYLALHDELVVSQEAAEDVRRIMETPPARLELLAGRTPILRTDLAVMGDRWEKPE